jgi:putative ABC transport system permease protein
VDEVIDDINTVLQDNGITASYGNIEQFTETLTSLIAMFQAIFNFAAGLIALVGAVGLLSTLSMSVFERQKEIGVMRSIGAPSSTIVGQFLTEGIVVGFVAWLIGLPLGYFLSKGLIAGLNLGEEYDLGFPIEAVIVGLVGMIIITTLASIWPSMVAARKTVSDILRYQ